jgi:hypothetical protein
MLDFWISSLRLKQTEGKLVDSGSSNLTVSCTISWFLSCNPAEMESNG